MADKKETPTVEEQIAGLTKRVALLEQTSMSFGLAALQNLGLIDANKMVEQMKAAADKAAEPKEETTEETTEEDK